MENKNWDQSIQNKKFKYQNAEEYNSGITMLNGVLFACQH